MSGFARTALEAKAFTDHRFAKLAYFLGLESADYALIRCARLWSWQTEQYRPDRPTYVVDEVTIDVAMGIRGAAAALVKAELAESTPEGFRIRGSIGRIEWLYQNRLNASSGGHARQRNKDNKCEPGGLPVGLPGGLPTGTDLRSDLPGSEISADQDRSASNNHVPPSRDADAIGKPGKKAKADRVHPRAWKAADYFRDLVLADSPTNALRNRKWEGQTGIRLEWAHSLHQIIERDGRTYEQLADVLDWLFHAQTQAHKFIVQSPGSLREKWDRIEAYRRNKTVQASDRPGMGDL